MIVIKDFFATWCSPCKRIDPILMKLKEEFPEIVIEKYNIELHPDLVISFKIKGVPTIIVEKDGEVISKTSGLNQYSFYYSIIKDIYEKPE